MRVTPFDSTSLGLGLTFALIGLFPTAALAQPKERIILKGHEGSIWSAAFSPDGKTLASAGADKTIRIWEVATGKELGALKGHNALVRSVAFSPDGKTLASAGQDEMDAVKLWNTVTWKELDPIKDTRNAWFASFSPDGKALAVEGPVILEMVSRKVVTPLEMPRGELCAAFSPNGKMIAAGSIGPLTVWDLATGKRLVTWAHEHAVWAVAFSPDSSMLASGGLVSGVKLFDVTTRKELPLEGEVGTGSVRSVAFSPDGKTLASADEGGKIKLWNVVVREKLYELRGAQDQGQALAFSPDGKTLASAGKEGITLWELSSGK